MSEMVERVARAMAFRLAAHNGAAYDDERDAPWKNAPEQPALGGPVSKAEFMAMARAVIEAMRKPTDAMVLAGAKYHHDNWRADHAREDTNAEAIWQDMIDVALQKETPVG